MPNQSKHYRNKITRNSKPKKHSNPYPPPVLHYSPCNPTPPSSPPRNLSFIPLYDPPAYFPHHSRYLTSPKHFRNFNYQFIYNQPKPQPIIHYKFSNPSLPTHFQPHHNLARFCRQVYWHTYSFNEDPAAITKTLEKLLRQTVYKTALETFVSFTPEHTYADLSLHMILYDQYLANQPSWHLLALSKHCQCYFCKDLLDRTRNTVPQNYCACFSSPYFFPSSFCFCSNFDINQILDFDVSEYPTSSTSSH